MECRGMSLAVIKISQKDVINNKTGNEDDSWHLTREDYMHGSVIRASDVFSDHPYGNPITQHYYSPVQMKRTGTRGWKTCW